jgi:hypothetical protein
VTTRAQQQSPAPSFSTTYSASTNRRTGDTADSNGNITYVNSQYLTYDIEVVKLWDTLGDFVAP